MEKETRSKILIVESEEDRKHFLRNRLEPDYEVRIVESGIAGIQTAREELPHLVLLNPASPILSGQDVFHLLKQDKSTKHIPVIFLPASQLPDDSLFHSIRTTLQTHSSSIHPFYVGSLQINPQQRWISDGQSSAVLTTTEFEIFLCLAQSAGDVVSRDQITASVCKDKSTVFKNRTIDVHIRAIRKKIPSFKRLLQSVYGGGYRLEAE